MATNRTVLKSYFQIGDKPTQSQFAELIDNLLHKSEDVATLQEVANNADVKKYVKPNILFKALQDLSPVRSVNNILPNNGNLNISNISGTAGSITGNIDQSHVTGLSNTLNTLGETIFLKHIAAILESFNLTGYTQQNLFPAGCNTFNFQANRTYVFRGRISISTGSVSHTTTLGWIASNLEVTSIETNFEIASSAGMNGLTSSTIFTRLPNLGTKVINNTATSAFSNISFDGILRTGSTAGSLSPVVEFNVDTGATAIVRRGSFIEFQELGVASIIAIGSVS